MGPSRARVIPVISYKLYSEITPFMDIYDIYIYSYNINIIIFNYVYIILYIHMYLSAYYRNK